METKPLMQREPCPDRILDDLGGGFAMGSIGGSFYYFLKGLKNSPRGERFVGGTQSVRMNVPRVSGGFAVWSGLFSTFDCSLVYLRGKEDPWNTIFAGAATCGFLRMRGGLRAAAFSTVGGGVLMALIEGAQMLMIKNLSARPVPPVVLEDLPSGAQGAASSWFEDLFKKKETQKSGNGAEPVILESDAPIPPTFDFK